MSQKRTLGPVALMFSAICGVMGSAWLFGPMYTAEIAGPASLVVWVIGAVAMMIIAMTFAELVCMMPVSGGNARFMHITHGTFAGFVFSWVLWLGYAAVAPAETMGIMQYLSSEFPALITQSHGVHVLTGMGYGVSALVLLGMCVLNFASIKWVMRYNSVIVWVKVLVPFWVAVVFIYCLFSWHHLRALPGGFMPNGAMSLGRALSMGGVIFAFAGFAPAIVLAGEAKNPQRTVPLVLFGALSVCLVLYLLLEFAFLGSITPAALKHGWAHVSLAHGASPFVSIAQLLHLHYFKYLILMTALLAPLGTAIIFVASSARVAQAMSETGTFPKIFSRLNKSHAPAMAVCLNFVVGMLLFFPSPGWQGMVGFLVSAFVLCYAVGPVCLLSFRKRLPNQTRPFKLPFAPVWSYIAFVVATAIVYWTGWTIYRQMLIAIVIGVVVLWVMRLGAKTKPAWQMGHGLWAIVYVAGLGVISYCGTFGGGHGYLKVGVDLIVLAIFALLMLVWGVASARSVDEIQVAFDAQGGIK
jgi:amino acid transporter